MKDKQGGDKRSDVAIKHYNVIPATQGNTRSYTVSRLQREAPSLFAQVGVNPFFTLALTQKNFAPRGLNLHDYLPRFRLQPNRSFDGTTPPYFPYGFPTL